MSKGHFYEQVIETSQISLELGSMSLSGEERRELTVLVSKNIHAVVLDTVLSELSGEDKKTFLRNLSENNHEKIWQHLKIKINKIEEKIKKSVEETKKELLEDIEKAKELGK